MKSTLKTRRQSMVYNGERKRTISNGKDHDYISELQAIDGSLFIVMWMMCWLSEREQ
jgi:hypothetical protein